MRLGIKQKLVVSFLLSNVLLASLMFAVSNWRFDQGFLAYVTQTEVQRMQPLVDELKNQYGKTQSWQPLLDDLELWNNLIFQNLDGEPQSAQPPRGGSPRPPPQMPRPPPGEDRGPIRGRPGPPDTGIFQHRVILGNIQKNVLIGPQDDSNQNAAWVDIEWNGAVVGYLGLVPPNFLQGSLDQLFVEEQKTAYAWIAAGSLLMAVLIGLVLASLWLRPIRRLQAGMQTLSAGDYESRLDVTSNDELAELSSQYNLLARTLSKNKSIQKQWIADISHELRTPVAVLRGEIEALVDGIRPINQDAIRSLHEEIQQLQALISELHELSLSDLGAMEYQKSSLDFSAFMTKLLSQFKKVGDETVIDLNYSETAEHFFIQADERKLKQLFHNLFHNTLNYTDRPGKLSVSWLRQGNDLEIHWADSAPNVGPEEKEKLFDRLFRAENSRNRSTGGSGLGLAIVRNIIEAHDGSIEVADSKLGGLEFVLRLPVN
jgi:two-component system sensor histidine kinase BaeS